MIQLFEIKRHIKMFEAEPKYIRTNEGIRLHSKLLYSQLNLIQEKLKEATVGMRILLQEMDPSEIPLPTSPSQFREARRLRVPESQLHMLWFNYDPNGDKHIYFCGEDIDNPGFGLIVLDHFDRVYNHHLVGSDDELSYGDSGYTLLGLSRRFDFEGYFQNYLEYHLAVDIRQLYRTKEFDRMLEAQYLLFTEPKELEFALKHPVAVSPVVPEPIPEHTNIVRRILRLNR